MGLDAFNGLGLDAFIGSGLDARGAGGIVIPYLIRLEVSNLIDTTSADPNVDNWMQQWWFHFGLDEVTETVHVRRQFWERNNRGTIFFPQKSFWSVLAYGLVSATDSSSFTAYTITEYTDPADFPALFDNGSDLWPRQDPDDADRVRFAFMGPRTLHDPPPGVTDIDDGPPDYYPEGYDYWVANTPTKAALTGDAPGFPTERDEIGDFVWGADDKWATIT